MASVIIAAIGSIIASTVTAPISAGVVVLLYTDLRMRREGLDLTLRTAAQSDSLTGGRVRFRVAAASQRSAFCVVRKAAPAAPGVTGVTGARG